MISIIPLREILKMFNREKTKEIFGYDIDPSIRRRTKAEFEATSNTDKKNLLVINNCPKCNAENTITYRASLKNKECSKCLHNSPKMLEVKKNQNKFVSEETKLKMSENHWSKKGASPVNKGQVMDEEFREKVSIATKIWADNRDKSDVKRSALKAAATKNSEDPSVYTLKTPESHRLHASSEYRQWEKSVLEKDNYRCQVDNCKHYKKNNLTAHHKNGFHWNIAGRYDVNNGATLCHRHHKAFHSMYGNINCSVDQYNEWLDKYKYKANTKTVFVVAGCSGSGKSWVCNQLTDKAGYISHDKIKGNVDAAIDSNSLNIVMYDPTVKVSTFINRHDHLYNIRAVFILETDLVVEERIKKRGGIFTKHIVKRNLEMRKRAAKYGEFSGTSQEVLDYLKTQIEKVNQ
jgi:Zn ribbon nucleic-acid-binding protein